MVAVAGGPSVMGSALKGSLFFARQSEPDLEFTEEELEQTTTIRSPSPMKPPKQSGGRPLLWALVVVLIGAGAYFSMEPEIVMDYLGPLLGESPPPPPQPPVAGKPMSPKPVPSAPVSQATPSTVTPPPPAPIEASEAAAPTAVPVPSSPAPQPMPTASTSLHTPVSPAPAPVSVSTTPLFSEGQRVSVLADPATPDEKVRLSLDAEGTRPGPAIPPGTALTILDGDLQGGGWVYSVRSDYGTKGWLAEKQLTLKP
jgi:hypothetical protein